MRIAVVEIRHQSAAGELGLDSIASSRSSVDVGELIDTREQPATTTPAMNHCQSAPVDSGTMHTSAPPPTPPLSFAGVPGTWMRAPDGQFAPLTVPRRFGLHPLDERDPRFHALARHERVEVATVPPFLLWQPEYVRSRSLRHRGLIARELDGTQASYADLWIDGTGYAFLRDAPTLALHAWPSAWAAGRSWYTYDGAELYGLVDVWAAVPGGRLIVDVERVDI